MGPLSILTAKVKTMPKFSESLLIVGEPGTGKTTVAKLWHDKYAIKNSPFIVLKCKETYETQADSPMRFELSGSVREAFKKARGGSLFLDDIEFFPAFAQGTLYRQLISSTPLIAINLRDPVRIIASCATDPAVIKKIDLTQGKLFSRLAFDEVLLSPLRLARQELPTLVQELVAEICSENRIPPVRISESVLFAIEEYDWPGNIHQLRAALSSAVSSSNGKEISFEHFTRQMARELERAAYDVVSRLQESG